MRILAIDTSSALTSVAVLDDDIVRAESERRDERRHAELLSVLVRAVLPSDVDVIACGVGPGPYSGVRAGIATAQALGLARGRPVVGVCSLDALAHAVAERELLPEFTVGIDARRREMYWGRYAADGTRLDGPHISWAEGWRGFGPDTGWFPRAIDVARVARAALARGERVTSGEVPLVAHATQHGATAEAIAGRTLLPPNPLYIRNPDIAS